MFLAYNENKYHATNGSSSTNLRSGRLQSRHISRSKPPKLWGWVMMEAGIERIKLNFVKQLSVGGNNFTDSHSMFSVETPKGCENLSKGRFIGARNQDFKKGGGGQ